MFTRVTTTYSIRRKSRGIMRAELKERPWGQEKRAKDRTMRGILREGYEEKGREYFVWAAFLLSNLSFQFLSSVIHSRWSSLTLLFKSIQNQLWKYLFTPESPETEREESGDSFCWLLWLYEEWDTAWDFEREKEQSNVYKERMNRMDHPSHPPSSRVLFRSGNNDPSSSSSLLFPLPISSHIPDLILFFSVLPFGWQRFQRQFNTRITCQHRLQGRQWVRKEKKGHRKHWLNRTEVTLKNIRSKCSFLSLSLYVCLSLFLSVSFPCSCSCWDDFGQERERNQFDTP